MTFLTLTHADNIETKSARKMKNRQDEGMREYEDEQYEDDEDIIVVTAKREEEEEEEEWEPEWEQPEELYEPEENQDGQEDIEEAEEEECADAEAQKAEEIVDSIQQKANSDTKEYAAFIYQTAAGETKTSQLFEGDGDSAELRISPSALEGGKVTAVVHNHPAGAENTPSRKDIKLANVLFGANLADRDDFSLYILNAGGELFKYEGRVLRGSGSRIRERKVKRTQRNACSG